MPPKSKWLATFATLARPHFFSFWAGPGGGSSRLFPEEIRVLYIKNELSIGEVA